MSHRAFVLDYQRFESALRPLLERALTSGDIEPLRIYIEAHRDRLTDPYEGQPLDDDWESMIETRDAHQYGDFALTSCYDPADDIGLGDAWPELEERLTEAGGDPQLMLGDIIGPPADPFDPGKMGSYVQSPTAVRAGLDRVAAFIRDHPDAATALEPVKTMLETAAAAGAGLYVTF